MRIEELWARVKQETIGENACFDTPFGRRRVAYADFGASGRAVRFIESYLLEMLELYGNTHTEDDVTGNLTTSRLHQAEKRIKELVHAGKEYHIIPAGNGATAAIHRLQEILGIYIPPASMDLFDRLAEKSLGEAGYDKLKLSMRQECPVVLVGPYEHHSNEISWRECFAEVIEVGLTEEGDFDLDDLEKKVSAPEYEHRQKIGSFSAASNVTGLITPVHRIAEIMHKHDGLVFFDYAAAAPYLEIDMCRDDLSSFDGIVFSPHKFLGGPGSCGILIIHEKIYNRNLPPSIAGGGTVEFVNAYTQEYNPKIEVRETAGTPGILQTLKAALALELKEKMDIRAMRNREGQILENVISKLTSCPDIEPVAAMVKDRHLPIFSFNIRFENSYFHPRFIVRLLNDLFGIQARAGCSCAGPYGHRLLKIDQVTSQRYEKEILKGRLGLKPGWTRLSLHYLMSDEEINFLCRAVAFVAEKGKLFLPLYSFELSTGEWKFKGAEVEQVSFGIDEALTGGSGACGEEESDLPRLYAFYIEEAERRAGELAIQYGDYSYKSTQRDLIPFVY
jgi:selenocysteine lyase/cysteine desulfurase